MLPHQLRRRLLPVSIVCVLISLLAVSSAAAQVQPDQATGNARALTELKIHSVSLEHNLLGDPADQSVTVYLPKAYNTNPEKRFPVIYLLHGYTGKREEWTTNGYQGMDLGKVMDERIASSAIHDVIVVVPNGRNKYLGSFYTNSSVTGNWEDFIYRELVSYVDANFRTLAQPESRGIAGHSMGGYGAIMLSMKHPDVFSAAYAFSPCCVGIEADLSSTNPAWTKALRATDIIADPQSYDDFYVDAFIALSAAFSPDPTGRGLLVRFPYREEHGTLVENGMALDDWKKHTPLVMAPTYKDNLSKLRGIYLDYGYSDEFKHIPQTVREYSAVLSELGVPHTVGAYQGTHGDGIRKRFEQDALPFFNQVLSFVPSTTQPKAPAPGH
jgi:S-formylglutathione hydrolase FrmB